MLALKWTRLRLNLSVVRIAYTFSKWHLTRRTEHKHLIRCVLFRFAMGLFNGKRFWSILRMLCFKFFWWFVFRFRLFVFTCWIVETNTKFESKILLLVVGVHEQNVVMCEKPNHRYFPLKYFLFRKIFCEKLKQSRQSKWASTLFKCGR